MTEVYNPLDKVNLGKSVADALLSRPVEPLGQIAPFEGAGIYSAATSIESQICAGDEIAIGGGGNSAGQAAVYLADAVKQFE